MKNLVTLGDLIADLAVGLEAFPIQPGQHQTVSGLTLGPGGAGNALVAAARLGLTPIALGGIGGDWAGERVLAQLRAEGVDCEHVTVMPGEPTHMAVILRAADGEHVFLSHAGTRGPEALSETGRATIAAAGALLVDGWTWRQDWPDMILAGARAAAQAGVPVLFDPGPAVEWIDAAWLAAMLAVAEVVLATEAEASTLARRLGLADPQTLTGRGAVLVVKRGAAGCRVLDRGQVWECPGIAVEARDLTGAGDCFAAAVAWGLLRELDWGVIGAVANAVGAAMVQKVGTALAAPTRAEVAASLRRHRPDLAGLFAPDSAAAPRSRRAPRCEG